MSQIQFHPTLTGTTPHIAASTLVPVTSKLFTPSTLPVTCDVSHEDTVNRTAAHLAKTAIKEALEEEEQELEDMEVQRIQEAAEQATATQLSVEKEKQVLETEKLVKLKNRN